MTRTSVLIGLVAAAAAAAASIGAVQGPPIATGPTVNVRLRLSRVSLLGLGGGGSVSNAQLRVGESATLTAYLGEPCGIGGNTTGDVRGAAHAWIASVTLMSASIDRIGVRVKWQRLDGGVPAASGSRELVMPEQTAYPIDLLTADTAYRERCRVAGDVIQISADTAALAETILDYEVWRVHEDGRGGRWRERTTTSARQGEHAEFFFTPVRWPLPSGCDVAIDVSGQILGRRRDDGTIEMAVSPSRFVRQIVPARFPSRLPARYGETGMKVFVAAAGEAVRLVLPPSEDQSNLPCGGPQAPSSRIDFGQLLANHQTSIIVRPTVRIPNS